MFQKIWSSLPVCLGGILLAGCVGGLEMERGLEQGELEDNLLVEADVFTGDGSGLDALSGQPDAGQTGPPLTSPDASTPDAERVDDTSVSENDVAAVEDATPEEDVGPPGCGASLTSCDGVCVDLMKTAAHCGQCNEPCSGGEVCSAGQCHSNEKIAGVLEHVNLARAQDQNCGQHGDRPAVGAVAGHALLHEASQRHADDMLANNFFSHTGSDGSSFSQRIRDTGYPGSPVGENIAGGDQDPARVVQRWMNSDGHCRNIMNGSATEIGVGYSVGGPWGSYWVLKLARR